MKLPAEMVFVSSRNFKSGMTGHRKYSSKGGTLKGATHGLGLYGLGLSACSLPRDIARASLNQREMPMYSVESLA